MGSDQLIFAGMSDYTDEDRMGQINKKNDILKKINDLAISQFDEIEYESASIKLDNPVDEVTAKDIPRKKTSLCSSKMGRKEKISIEDIFSNGTEDENTGMDPENNSCLLKNPQEKKSSSDISFPVKETEISGTPEKTKQEKIINSDYLNKSDTQKIALIYNTDHEAHSSVCLGMESPERPQRLTDAYWYLKKNRIFEDDKFELFTRFEMARERDILRVHTSSYVDFIRSYASKGGGFLGDSTYITPQSYEIALMAAGGAIKAAELVIDENYLCSFALIRPPGHHAGSDKYSGFCMFNNAAVLARYLQQVKGLKKILILDWDAHAGNGTMDIFYSDPTVMTVSIHRDPADYYPRTGFIDQTGEGAGKGFTANIEMPQGSGDEEYIMAFKEVIIPLINRFSPDFVICCCGFDGYYQEKNNKLKLTAEGYYQIGKILRDSLSVDFTLLLEGGYHRFNGQLCHSILSSLLGRKNPINESDIFSQYELGIQKKIYQKAQKNIADVKELFSIK